MKRLGLTLLLTAFITFFSFAQSGMSGRSKAILHYNSEHQLIDKMPETFVFWKITIKEGLLYIYESNTQVGVFEITEIEQTSSPITPGVIYQMKLKGDEETELFFMMSFAHHTCMLSITRKDGSESKIKWSR